MSLVGNLQELGLGEIFQIVGLSRKTGVLFLNCPGKDGSVFFRLGQVVLAASSSYQQSIGEVLLQKRVIDPAVLGASLDLQKQSRFRERLGLVLIKHFGIPPETIEEAVREHIENIVFSLFAWTEGTFRFEARDSVETVDGIQFDPVQFMLDQGLNSQFLAMEGSRFHRTPLQSHPQNRHKSVVIVDDDAPTLRVIADRLAETGWNVHTATGSEDLPVTVDALLKDGERPAVLIDLIMPKKDGSGLLGGVELLELLHATHTNLRMIIMTDYHHADAEKKIRELGYHYILKPRRSEITSSESVDTFIDRFSEAVHQ
jgi:CheY-like chemotaxis protein